MEVPGKKLQQIASAIDDSCCQLYCHDGESVQAEGYCTSCKKALYEITHKKEIQSQCVCGQDSMPASIGDKSNDEESYEPCEEHPDEIIKYFCSSHDLPVCGHCLAFNHRSCNVSLISELCKAENESVNNDIVDFLTDVDEYASKIENNKNFVTQISKAEVLKLREYRDDIEKYFDQRTDFLLENIQQMKSMDETLLDSLKPKCDHMKSKAETIKLRLSCLESNPAKLFIETKRAQTELAGLRSTLAGMNKEKIIHEYRFEKDSITKKLLASKTGLGKIKEKHEAPRKTQPHVSRGANEHVLLFAVVLIGIIVHAAFINKGNQTVITSLRFTRDSDIRVIGYMMEMLLLPGNRMLLADLSSNKIEMIDMQTNKLMSEVSLPDQPQSMAILPGDKLAVCLKIIGRIQFVKTLGQLSLEDHIKMAGR
ncbi:uncharacterized protein LOC128239111 [Mya arenaria]|uniref:uncharacterized protein LOC128239111 n=1 Tax=Mya arenaria TaxID=6604 RepID=UPI0022E1424B|nr:uncharacterized protein LOC128239111 [Mya arenaria]